MTDKIENMTDDDFKKIMNSIGMPDSRSLYAALKQVMNDEQIKTLIHASKIIEQHALAVSGSEVEFVMSVYADIERIVWEAGYHCKLDADGDLIYNYTCLCSAYSASECACGAWDVPLAVIFLSDAEGLE